jgi:hypothetical protein
MLKNPLAFFPVYLKIADQIEKMKMQAFFFLIKDKLVAAVISNFAFMVSSLIISGYYACII